MITPLQYSHHYCSATSLHAICSAVGIQFLGLCMSCTNSVRSGCYLCVKNQKNSKDISWFSPVHVVKKWLIWEAHFVYLAL